MATDDDTNSEEQLTPAQHKRRQAILRAAEHLFAEGRFDEVLMEDVAREAGVGKGTLYRYFADKDSLYFAVVFEGFAALQRRLRAEADDGAPAVRLEHTVRAVVLFLSRNRFVFRLMGRDDGEGGRRREHWQQWKRQRSELVDAVAQVLRLGARQGVFEVPHLHTDAQILLGMVRSCLRFNEQGLTPDQIVAEVVRIFLRGVARPPRPEADA